MINFIQVKYVAYLEDLSVIHNHRNYHSFIYFSYGVSKKVESPLLI